MDDESFEPWAPVDVGIHRPVVVVLRDDDGGFTLHLTSERKGDRTSGVLRIRFAWVVGYRNINESFRLATWGRLGDQMNRFPGLFKVRDSRWIRWLVSESANTLAAERLTHYAIYTPEDCVDIVAECDPEVGWELGDGT